MVRSELKPRRPWRGAHRGVATGSGTARGTARGTVVSRLVSTKRQELQSIRLQAKAPRVRHLWDTGQGMICILMHIYAMLRCATTCLGLFVGFWNYQDDSIYELCYVHTFDSIQIPWLSISHSMRRYRSSSWRSCGVASRTRSSWLLRPERNESQRVKQLM